MRLDAHHTICCGGFKVNEISPKQPPPGPFVSGRRQAAAAPRHLPKIRLTRGYGTVTFRSVRPSVFHVFPDLTEHPYASSDQYAKEPIKRSDRPGMFNSMLPIAESAGAASREDCKK
jgi:hypothetical protein